MVRYRTDFQSGRDGDTANAAFYPDRDSAGRHFGCAFFFNRKEDRVRRWHRAYDFGMYGGSRNCVSGVLYRIIFAVFVCSWPFDCQKSGQAELYPLRAIFAGCKNRAVVSSLKEFEGGRWNWERNLMEEACV